MNAAREKLQFCQTCGQNIHDKCIKQWLEDHDRCPSCQNVFYQRFDSPALQEPEIDADSFDVYVQWLYTDKLVFSTNNDADNGNLFQLLASTYVLGEKVQDTRFCQAIALKSIFVWEDEDGMMDLSEVVKCIYDNTAVGSRLRNFAADVLYVVGDADNLDGDLPYEFQPDFAKASFQVRPKTRSEVIKKYCGDFWTVDLD